jgi:hypothetical protein
LGTDTTGRTAGAGRTSRGSGANPSSTDRVGFDTGAAGWTTGAGRTNRGRGAKPSSTDRVGFGTGAAGWTGDAVGTGGVEGLEAGTHHGRGGFSFRPARKIVLFVRGLQGTIIRLKKLSC